MRCIHGEWAQLQRYAVLTCVQRFNDSQQLSRNFGGGNEIYPMKIAQGAIPLTAQILVVGISYTGNMYVTDEGYLYVTATTGGKCLQCELVWRHCDFFILIIYTLQGNLEVQFPTRVAANQV